MKIAMFRPYVNNYARRRVSETLKTRWIGQADKVNEFERSFGQIFNVEYPVSVNSGTSALSLAYYLADIRPGDEVISPVFTCSATNIALLHTGAKIIFADIDPETLNPSADDIRRKITPKTKAIVNVHLYGNISDIGSFDLPIIGDMAQAHYPPVNEDFVCYSFQAIKHITTGDGGMIVVKTPELYERAKRLRWFGIDREAKKNNGWQVHLDREIVTNIVEAGWKYQMNDIAASMGLGALSEYDTIMNYHAQLSGLYSSGLSGTDGITVIGGTWSFPLLVERRDDFARLLSEHGVETNVVHVRNDILSIFGGKRQDLPSMNAVEEKYISLPLHMYVMPEDVEKICNLIKKGW